MTLNHLLSATFAQLPRRPKCENGRQLNVLRACAKDRLWTSETGAVWLRLPLFFPPFYFIISPLIYLLGRGNGVPSVGNFRKGCTMDRVTILSTLREILEN